LEDRFKGTEGIIRSYQSENRQYETKKGPRKQYTEN